MRTPAPTNESWPTTVPAPAPSASDLMPQSVIGVGESFRWSRAGHGVGAPAYENQEENGVQRTLRIRRRDEIFGMDRFTTSWDVFKNSRTNDVKWCHPKLVVEVKHLAGSKLLRHAGLRGV
jgi:hypothetical protein